jgi:hypothetical protein
MCQWRKLSEDEQGICDQLSDAAKNNILTRPPPRPPNLSAHAVNNLDDISAHDCIQTSLHDLRMGSEDDVNEQADVADAEEQASQLDGDDEGIQAFLSKTSNPPSSKSKPALNKPRLPPGDITKVLSSTVAFATIGARQQERDHHRRHPLQASEHEPNHLPSVDTPASEAGRTA